MHKLIVLFFCLLPTYAIAGDVDLGIYGTWDHDKLAANLSRALAHYADEKNEFHKQVRKYLSEDDIPSEYWADIKQEPVTEVQVTEVKVTFLDKLTQTLEEMTDWSKELRSKLPFAQGNFKRHAYTYITLGVQFKSGSEEKKVSCSLLIPPENKYVFLECPDRTLKGVLDFKDLHLLPAQ